jgi:hypothetical protein
MLWNSDNTDITFNPKNARNQPEYFANNLMTCPDPIEFEETVPFSMEFTSEFIHRPQNAHMFKPKQMHFRMREITYFISPYKAIRRTITQGRDFSYADYFNTE